LVRHLPGKKGEGEVRHELYDLENDPQETEDVATDNSKVVERLAAILDKEIDT
jgi:hypothetical protein